MSKLAISDVLVKKNKISPEDLAKAKAEQKNTGEKLTTTLVKMGYIKDSDMAEQMSELYGVPSVDLSSFEIPPDAIASLDVSICQKYNVIPISKAGSILVVAFADPSNIFVKDDLAFITKCKVEPVVATEVSIQKSIERYYRVKTGSSEYGEILSELEEGDLLSAVAEDQGVLNLADAKEDDPVVKFVNMALLEAIKRGASDIHVEPYEKKNRVRFRIDGKLIEVFHPPASIASAVSSRIKVISKLDIAERRLPQDGRIKVITPNNKGVDFRVSILPTVGGEKVVMRILDKSKLKLDLNHLGFEQDDLKVFREAINRPQGLVLVTGPTGSGKTTTLYSALQDIHEPSINISTAEDPVEFRLEGINQVQVRTDIGFTFAEALRSFLRQDPDVILVGEIRDKETADIAFQASATGHLVLSTLHTNDAPRTISRLLDMGVPGFLISSTIELIIAQRLLSVVCDFCKEPQHVPDNVLIQAGVKPADLKSFNNCMKGAGCDYCNETGNKGRIAIYELMTMSEEIKQASLNGANPIELQAAAIRGGMRTLRQAALQKLKAGKVSISTVLNSTMQDPEV